MGGKEKIMGPGMILEVPEHNNWCNMSVQMAAMSDEMRLQLIRAQYESEQYCLELMNRHPDMLTNHYVSMVMGDEPRPLAPTNSCDGCGAHEYEWRKGGWKCAYCGRQNDRST